MTLTEEFPYSAITDAFQGRARCESDAIQKEWEEYIKAATSKVKPFSPINFQVPKVETYSDEGGKLYKRYVFDPHDYSINVQTPKLFNPYTSFLGMDPASPDSDPDLHIKVKRRNIKFNFNN